MISSIDRMVGYLRSVQNSGCFGKDASAWAVAITQMETQSDEMRKDREIYISVLSIMAKAESKQRK